MNGDPSILREVLQTARDTYFRRVEAELQKLADALNQWLHDLFARPRRDWRAGLDQFFAQQQAQGRLVSSESRRQLIAFLESWSKTVNWSTVEGMQDQVRPVPSAADLKGEKEPNSRPQPVRRRERFIRRTRMPESHARFSQKLAEAEALLSELKKALAPLGQKLDQAKPDEVVEVESEVNAIEKLIWRHNDAMESAREIWLQHSLGYHALNRLAAMSSPSAFGLPVFPDEQQAERARKQWKQIGERTGRSIANLDRVIFGMQALETAGMLAGLALGAGVVITAVRLGGKLAIVKTVAKLAAAGAAAAAVGEAAEQGLRAAGASEETIHGVQLAAELVTWLLLLRRTRPTLGNATPRRTLNSSTKAETRRSSPKLLSGDAEGRPAGTKRRAPNSGALQGRYSRSASDRGAYWASNRRVFPTRRNSGLSGRRLRNEQEAFLFRGLQQGKSPAELRGQAAAGGYERRGGVGNVGGPDRLADRGAEAALQRAIKATNKAE